MTSEPPGPVVAAQARAQQLAAARYDRVLRESARAEGRAVAGDNGSEITHAVKGTESLYRKTENERADGVTLDEALLRTPDLNRYTVLLDEADYTSGVERFRERLAEHGLIYESGKNTWDDPFYKGYNARFRDQHQPHAGLDPDQVDDASPRHLVEVQFHTPASYAAKSDNHDRYKLSRSGDLSPDEKDAANELQAQRNEQVTAPPGHERLGSRIPARQRRPDIPQTAFDRIRQRLESQRDEPDGQPQDPSRTVPEQRSPPEHVDAAAVPGSGPQEPVAQPVTGPRRLTPEQSSAGQREHHWDTERDGGGREGPERG